MLRIGAGILLFSLDFPFEDNLEAGGANWLPDGQWTVVADEGYGGSAALSLNPGADYDDGSYFNYSYDAVGNRLSEGTNESSSEYAYDAANHLVEVDGVAYSWDANGNLLSDGISSYSYNHANRLVGVSQGSYVYSCAYNGLCDRLQQVVNGVTTSYTLDLNTGLTQVLADGTNAYLYGLGRIGELQPDGWMYHLPDALGSVRQLSGPDAVLALA